MNIAVTNVSRISFDKSKQLVHREYVDEEGNQYDGVMTNEAPLKSLIKRLSAKGETLDKVIFIESNAARKKNEIPGYKDKYSPADFLRHRIMENIEEGCLQYDKDKDSIYIDDEPNESSVSKAVYAVYERMLELYEENQRRGDGKGLKIYIEANGGIRYVLTMLLSIMRTLENSLNNFHIEEIISMVLNQEPVRIFNTKAVYDTSQISNIIEEYVNYGRISSLEKYARSLFAHSEENIKTDVKRILQDLAKLAADIQLCRTRMMLDDFYLDGGIGQLIDEFLKKYNEIDDASVGIFNYILRYIKAEYDKGIYKGYEPGHNNIVYLPKVIEWCLDKDYIQQAITLCSERIPEYLFVSGKIRLSDQLQNLLDSAKTHNYEPSYYFFANMRQEFLSKMDNAIVQASLNDIKNMDIGHEVLSEENWEKAKAELKTPFSFNAGVPFERIAQRDKNKIYSLASEYKRMRAENINNATITSLITIKGFSEDVLQKEIRISSKRTEKIINVFQGKYNDNGVLKEHNNLMTKEQRLIKIIPELIRLFLPSPQNSDEYKQIIDEVFENEADSFTIDLKNKYADEQSSKYYIRDAMHPVFEHIQTNLSGGADDLQRILYLFSMCKEQRNFSNHAHVSANDRSIAMNTKQLGHLIDALLIAVEK